MRINELKAILADIDQTIAKHSMTARMGRIGRYVMVKDDTTGKGYDINLSLDHLSVTCFLAKDDIYKTKGDYHQLTPKQFMIVRHWLGTLIINGRV